MEVAGIPFSRRRPVDSLQAGPPDWRWTSCPPSWARRPASDGLRYPLQIKKPLRCKGLNLEVAGIEPASWWAERELLQV